MSTAPKLELHIVCGLLGPLTFLTTHTCHAPHRHRGVPVRTVDRMPFMPHYLTQYSTGYSITCGLCVLSVLKTSKCFWCSYSKMERTDALHVYTINQTKHKHWPPLRVQILEEFGQSKGWVPNCLLVKAIVNWRSKGHAALAKLLRCKLLSSIMHLSCLFCYKLQLLLYIICVSKTLRSSCDESEPWHLWQSKVCANS